MDQFGRYTCEATNRLGGDTQDMEFQRTRNNKRKVPIFHEYPNGVSEIFMHEELMINISKW